MYFFLRNTVFWVKEIDYDQKVCIVGDDPGMEKKPTSHLK